MEETIEQFVFVELDNGDQEFFDSPYEAFRFAKKHEAKRKGSVEYVAVGLFYGEEDEADACVYKGQYLRYMLRSLDNTVGWLKSVAEVLNDRKDEQD